jgi:non-specific protein-tyrosine kinase
MFTSVEHPLDTLLVTAAAHSEDKSLVLANLAVTFAQAGNKTILVDSDLRRPQQHEIWGVPNERGLTSMILEDSAMSNPPLAQTEVPNLWLLPSGVLPPIPADVLSSQRMVDVIGVLKARAHYILFDAPPVLAATDAALLGAKLDGVVLVMRVGSTRRDQAARARQALERVHVRVLGAVLTNAQGDSVGSY